MPSPPEACSPGLALPQKDSGAAPAGPALPPQSPDCIRPSRASLPAFPPAVPSGDKRKSSGKIRQSRRFRPIPHSEEGRSRPGSIPADPQSAPADCPAAPRGIRSPPTAPPSRAQRKPPGIRIAARPMPRGTLPASGLSLRCSLRRTGGARQASGRRSPRPFPPSRRPEGQKRATAQEKPPRHSRHGIPLRAGRALPGPGHSHAARSLRLRRLRRSSSSSCRAERGGTAASPRPSRGSRPSRRAPASGQPAASRHPVPRAVPSGTHPHGRPTPPPAPGGRLPAPSRTG